MPDTMNQLLSGMDYTVQTAPLAPPAPTAEEAG
jgi:hypothetical protein